MPRHPRTPIGFTLIELLIVVAIIAILAAIAIPNMLEAQTRSKVSRTKADMRTLATALESYRVDYPRYPVAYKLQDVAIDPRIARLAVLTTPVAYVTSVPVDIFSRDRSNSYTEQDIRVFVYMDKHSYGRFVTDAWGAADNGQNIYRLLWTRDLPAGEWLLRSRGPRGTTGGVGSALRLDDVYDPTNGTISDGNIIYFGPGIGFGGR